MTFMLVTSIIHSHLLLYSNEVLKSSKRKYDYLKWLWQMFDGGVEGSYDFYVSHKYCLLSSSNVFKRGTETK